MTCILSMYQQAVGFYIEHIIIFRNAEALVLPSRVCSIAKAKDI